MRVFGSIAAVCSVAFIRSVLTLMRGHKGRCVGSEGIVYCSFQGRRKRGEVGGIEEQSVVVESKVLH